MEVASKLGPPPPSHPHTNSPSHPLTPLLCYYYPLLPSLADRGGGIKARTGRARSLRYLPGHLGKRCVGSDAAPETVRNDRRYDTHTYTHIHTHTRTHTHAHRHTHTHAHIHTHIHTHTHTQTHTQTQTHTHTHTQTHTHRHTHTHTLS